MAGQDVTGVYSAEAHSGGVWEGEIWVAVAWAGAGEQLELPARRKGRLSQYERKPLSGSETFLCLSG